VRESEAEMVSTGTKAPDQFTEFFAASEPRLRHALIASCGPEVGREAAADALEYAWSHWDRVGAMDHPTAYLYRVGRSAARKYRTRRWTGDDDVWAGDPWVEPALPSALLGLSERQRVAVVLRHGFGYTFNEIAATMGISITSVQKHIERGMEKLRRGLEVGHG
jgi:DNA-directed RNA polymerase specialized sigma24 family protein